MNRFKKRALRKSSHSVYFLVTHMGFNTKYRGKVLKGEIADECVRTIRNICEGMAIQIISLAVCIDHVHLFILHPPKYSFSHIANVIKGKTSRHLRQKFPELKKWYKKGLWAPGCFHRTVGQEYEVVKRYIDEQKKYPKAKLFPDNDPN